MAGAYHTTYIYCFICVISTFVSFLNSIHSSCARLIGCYFKYIFLCLQTRRIAVMQLRWVFTMHHARMNTHGAAKSARALALSV